MPPNYTLPRTQTTATIDLTGDSDDDLQVTSSIRPPRSGGRAVFDAHEINTHARNVPKSTPSGRGTPSRRPNGRAAIDDLSPVRITRTSQSPHVNGTSTKSPPRKSLNSELPKLGERGNRLSGTMDSSQAMSQRGTGDAIIITDDANDDSRPTPDPPRFKIPRGLEATKPIHQSRSSGSFESLQTASRMDIKRFPPANRLSSSFDSPRSPLKRPRDDDSQSGSSIPPKKPKIRQSFTNRHSTPASDDASQTNSESRATTRQSLLTKTLSQKSSSRINSESEPIDLDSPPRKAKNSSLSGRATDEGEVLKNEQPSSKSMRMGTRASSLGEGNPSPRRSQRDFQSFDTEIQRQQPSTHNKERNIDDDTQSSHSGSSIKRRDTTPRIRKETAKAQEISASKKAKSQSRTDSQSPPDQPQTSNSRAADLSKPVQPANGGHQSLAEGKSLDHNGRDEASHVAPKRKSKIFPGDDAPNGDEQYTPNSSVSTGNDFNDANQTERVKSSGLDRRTPGRSSPAIRAKEIQRAGSASEFATNDGSLEADATPSRARRSNKENAMTTRSSVLENLSPGAGQTPIRFEDLVPPAGLRTGDTVVKDATTLADEADLQLRSEAMKSDDQRTSLNGTKTSFAKPKMAASAMRPSSSYSKGLPLGAQVEKVLGKYLEELGDDNEYWTSVSMNRARLSKEGNRNLEPMNNGARQDTQHDKPTSFAKLRPHGLSQHQKGNMGVKSDQLWGIERMSSTGRPAGPTWVSSTYRPLASDVADVPNYAHYVSIKNNILAPNVTKLICWPYFGDDFDCNTADNLREQYHLDIDARERKLVLLLKAQKYEEYVESALADLECSWADVLRFLLEPHPDVGSSSDAMKALSSRQEFCEQDFSRISERWRSILTVLPPSNPEKLGRAAVLCDNFQKLAKFSLWHVARRSEYAKLPGEELNSPENVQPSDNELTCRICLRFNCPYHGELKEQPDMESDDESESTVDSIVATDIVHPPRLNYRTRVAIPPPYLSMEDKFESTAARNDKKDPKFWRKDDFNQAPDDRGPFYPCYHPGTSCMDAQCSCFENKLPCEKICSCAPDCKRKFQGCSCSTERYKKGNRGPCFEDERCACYQSGRECDPDLCGGCGACEVVDPVNKYEDGILVGRCRNCSIQRGVPKQTLLGDSGVHGLGLYACEDIREHDFVGEYKGEIITKEEAERRGAVYEIQKLSYLFSLNATQEIDSTNFGNKVRFINHAKGKANLYPRIIMVNTVHRIALYASCNINPGQELFFDYGPKFPDDQLGGKKQKKSAPHVRNAELTRTFLEIEESEDEIGNVRAKGITHARTKSKNKKARGGARANAGRKPRVRQHDETASIGAFTEQDAGERLAAFNISDEVRSDLMDVDVEAGADEDDDFELDEASEFSDDSVPDEESESDV